MATIRERQTKNGKRYQAIVRLKGHPPERATFSRKTDARRWAESTESAIREKRYFKQSKARKHTLSQVLDRYEKEILPRFSDESRKPHIEFWRKRLGAYTLADLESDVINDEKLRLVNEPTHQSDTRSPSTVNRYLATLSHALSVARKEWQWMDHNPFKGVSKFSEPRERIRFLSDEERAALLDSCKASRSPYLYPIVLLALSTGMRQGEITGLRWKDIDLVRGAATIKNTKNSESRFVPLVGTALAELKRLSKIRRIETSLVFAGKNGESPVNIREAWASALERAGIEDFRFHDLRHTAASYLAMNGASASEIAAVLGHKTLAMVKRYAHVSNEHTSSIVASMNERFLG